jgi:site-specific recombinase XerD
MHDEILIYSKIKVILMKNEGNSSHIHEKQTHFMSQVPRCLRLFEQGIRSPATYKTYKLNLDKFFEWAGKNCDELLIMPSDELQELLEEYLFYLKKKLNPNSLNPHLAAIDKFLAVNDIEYKNRKLRMFLPEKIKSSGIKAWTTQHIQKMLEYADSKRAKALIHFLSASGVRVGALEELKWKNIEEISNVCYCVTIYPKSNHEYVTFLHHEARKALDEYTEERRKSGELISRESYVFSTRWEQHIDIPRSLTRKGVESVILRVVKRAGIERTKEEDSVRFDIAIDTGFRKRFNTILKSNPNISYAIAERMMDHKTYLESHYLDTTNKEKFFEEYRKAIPDLIIDDSERLRARNQKLEADLSEKEKLEDEVARQGQAIDNFIKKIEDLEKKKIQKMKLEEDGG